jgi:N-terminal half of MaoC dehydratase
MTSVTQELPEWLRAAIGRPTVAATVVVERTPVTLFADAVFEPSPAFRDLNAAQEVGLSNVPAPPTFSFAMATAGGFAELQPPDTPENAMTSVLDKLRASGGTILHGEQEFVYHRPMVVGDVLAGSGRIANIYQKHSSSQTMTFIVNEVTWRAKATAELVIISRSNIIHRA